MASSGKAGERKAKQTKELTDNYCNHFEKLKEVKTNCKTNCKPLKLYKQ